MLFLDLIFDIVHISKSSLFSFFLRFSRVFHSLELII